MKNIIKFFALFAFLFAAISAFTINVSAQNRTEILIVADQKTSCRGIVAQDCLQVKHLNEERFNILRQNIQGFRYTAGYYYVLEVRSTNRGGYRLQRILAQVRTEDISSQPVPLPTPLTLSGIDWKLTRIENQPVNSEKAMIKFDEQNDRVGGNGGCNGFGGNLTVNGNSLRVSRVISTKMFCQEGSDIENKFFNNLEKVTRYDFSNGRLQLFAGSRVVLEFERR